jgi:hypothetical protein
LIQTVIGLTEQAFADLLNNIIGIFFSVPKLVNFPLFQAFISICAFLLIVVTLMNLQGSMIKLANQITGSIGLGMLEMVQQSFDKIKNDARSNVQSAAHRLNQAKHELARENRSTFKKQYRAEVEEARQTKTWRRRAIGAILGEGIWRRVKISAQVRTHGMVDHKFRGARKVLGSPAQPAVDVVTDAGRSVKKAGKQFIDFITNRDKK